MEYGIPPRKPAGAAFHLIVPIVCVNFTAPARPGVEKNRLAGKKVCKKQAKSNIQVQTELSSVPYLFKQMEEEHSKLWRLALIVSLIAFAAVAYFRIPPFRNYVDDKFPEVKKQLVQRGINIVDDPTQADEKQTPQATVAMKKTRASKPAITLEQVAANREIWPKEVLLKTQVVFPAVFNGREVGKITVLAGTAVQLYQIQHQKLAVIYKGGGTWVPVAETDLLERVQAAIR